MKHPGPLTSSPVLRLAARILLLPPLLLLLLLLLLPGLVRAQGGGGDNLSGTLGAIRPVPVAPNEGMFDLNQPIALLHVTPDKQFEQAVARLKAGDAAGALRDFDEIAPVLPPGAVFFLYRASARRLVGDLAGSMADCQAALKAEPNNSQAYNYLAIVKIIQGDYAGAKADLDRAIEIEPKHANAYYQRVRAEYFARDWENALADLRRFCELTGTRQDYERLMIWLLRVRLGATKIDASKPLETYFRQRSPTVEGDWVSRLAGHLAGSVNEADLLAAAATAADPKVAQGQRCEAWYYIGMKKLVAGERGQDNDKEKSQDAIKAAAEAFRQCLSTGQKDYIEYERAESELKALAGAATP